MRETPGPATSVGGHRLRRVGNFQPYRTARRFRPCGIYLEEFLPDRDEAQPAAFAARRATQSNPSRRAFADSAWRRAWARCVSRPRLSTSSSASRASRARLNHRRFSGVGGKRLERRRRRFTIAHLATELGGGDVGGKHLLALGDPAAKLSCARGGGVARRRPVQGRVTQGQQTAGDGFAGNQLGAGELTPRRLQMGGGPRPPAPRRARSGPPGGRRCRASWRRPRQRDRPGPLGSGLGGGDGAPV